MSEPVVAVLVVAAEGDPGRLHANGPCWASPPKVLLEQGAWRDAQVV